MVYTSLRISPRSKQSSHILSAIGGSLVVCLVTPAAIYLSADSRYVNAPLGLRDTARKLIACGRSTLCGLSGLLRFTRTERDRPGAPLAQRTTFDLSNVVEQLRFEEANVTEPQLADLFAKHLHLALAPIWERFAINLDEPFGYTASPGLRAEMQSLRLAQLFYANREASGRAFLANIDLTHTLRRSNSGRYSSVLDVPIVRRSLFSRVKQPRLYLRGLKRCVRPEPLYGTVDGDADALLIIQRVFERARYATRCATAIGGPVDIAVIDAAGRRWLKHKPECRKSSEDS